VHPAARTAFAPCCLFFQQGERKNGGKESSKFFDLPQAKATAHHNSNNENDN